jgi:phosphate-selective porin OprO/OprP
VYGKFKELPYLQTLFIGHVKEPFFLERQTGAGSTTFMERSLPDAFTPGRNVGFMVRRISPSENATCTIGVFRSDFNAEIGRGVGDDGGFSLGTRLTCLPVYDEVSAGRGLVHLGIAYNYHDERDNEVRFRERPEAHLADFFVSTGKFDASDYHLFGLEAALVYGPLSLQSEYVRSTVNQSNGPAVGFDGFYIYGSYFLTGEHRRYSRKRGAFRRPKPFEKFFSANTPSGIRHGSGAWEFGLRWSYLDLDDENIRGGRLSDFTAGLNWYLNDDARVMWNYVYAALDDPVVGWSHANIFQTRFQIVF